MPLTDTRIRTAKRARKPYKLTDSAGLHLVKVRVRQPERFFYPCRSFRMARDPKERRNVMEKRTPENNALYGPGLKEPAAQAISPVERLMNQFANHESQEAHFTKRYKEVFEKSKNPRLGFSSSSSLPTRRSTTRSSMRSAQRSRARSTGPDRKTPSRASMNWARKKTSC
jgi:hypothetical protein